MRFRLVPRDPQLGWTPYAWLVYAVPFVLYPFLRGVPAHEWVANGVGLALFLVLYFRSFWVEDLRVLACAAGLAGLGAVLTPINPFASTFFVYAAASLAAVADARLAARVLAGFTAFVAAYGWVMRVPRSLFLSSLVFTVLIGAINIHFGAVRRQADRRREQDAREAEARERERIARDLHDLLGQTLSVIVLKAELAGKLLSRDPSRAEAEIRDVERISREALGEVRAAVRGYRGGLQAEIAQARTALSTAGVAFECEAAPLALQPAQDGVLALALREAVTNVLRHADARACRVRLEPTDGGARLVVEDDGRGGGGPEGAGLQGMRERVAALGGRIERATAGGTRLSVWLPTGGLG